MRTIYINTNKVSKVRITGLFPVRNKTVKFYPKKEGWFNGYEEGYYVEEKQGNPYSKYRKTTEHTDIDGYLYYRPELVVFGEISGGILFNKYFDTFQQAEEYFQNNFKELIDNDKIIKL